MALKPVNFFTLIGVLIAAELTCSLESTMVFVTLPSLYARYGDPAHVSWVMTAFFLTAAGTAAIGGRLGDIYGRTRVLSVTLAIACAGSVVSAVGTSLNMIIAGRALQGASLAILPLCYGIVREMASGRWIAVGIGALGATYAIGVGMGSVLGGFIVQKMSWQGIFVVTAVLAGVTLLASVFLLPASRRYFSGPIDFGGGLLLMPAIALLLLAFTNMVAWGFASSTFLLVLSAGAVLLALWVAIELRHKNPLIDLRLLKNRQILFANICLFVFAVGPLLEIVVFMPLLQQPAWSGVGFGVSPVVAGAIIAAATGTASLASLAAGYASARIGCRNVVLAGAIVSVLGWVFVIFEHSSIWSIVAMVLLLIGPAVTMIFVFAPNLVLEAAPEERASEATGMTQVIRGIGTSIGTQILGILLSTNLVRNPDGSGQTLPGEPAYVTVFVVMLVLSILGVAALLMIPQPATGKSKLPAGPEGVSSVS